ncbi:MAG TPA: Uma2 family endonuclease [Bryobacteraceae bacterium]|jgi:Uma2 family endonuclease|nr:Uma2 family endonuclease [Bryobacteraceae bacterium]
MSSRPNTFLTPEQYLEIERKAGQKSEYYAGEMYAMSGASHEHNVVSMALAGLLFQQLRKRPCHVYTHDMRVRVSRTGLYTYPDVVAVCGDLKFADDCRDTLLNPTFLAEVLSPSTEAYDRGRKFEHYRSIESLGEYLVVAQDRLHADLYTRQADGRWLLSEASRPEDSLDLPSIGCRIAMADLYEKMSLPLQPGAPA